MHVYHVILTLHFTYKPLLNLTPATRGGYRIFEGEELIQAGAKNQPHLPTITYNYQTATAHAMAACHSGLYEEGGVEIPTCNC